MAITLDELLGRNTRTANDETIERFPSYEDFSSHTRNQEPSYDQQERQNFTVRQYSAPRNPEQEREYAASRPYVAPRSNEYQAGSYDFYDVVQNRRTARVAEPIAQNAEQDYGYANYQAYANPAYQTAERRQNLYEFTRNDHDRLSDDELYEKLSSTSAPSQTAFAPRAAAPVQRAAAPMQRANSSVERTSEFSAVRPSYKSQSAKKSRLNTKGKILLAVYVAVIVLVAVLVIINARDINKGDAVTPTSSVGAYASAAIESNSTEIGVIQYGYDAGYNIR